MEWSDGSGYLMGGVDAGNDVYQPLTHDQFVTLAVILSAVVGLAAYDVWVAYARGTGATESWLLTKLAMRAPTIPFSLGYLMGHFFSGQSGIPDLNQS